MMLALRMQRMETTLRERLPEMSSRPLQERVAFLAKLSWQVAALHKTNQLHGNITPEAVQIKDGGPELAPPSPEVKKTLGYSAPELLRGERQAHTIKTDIFSLGVLCYELLSSQKPFEGASDMQVLLATLEGKPRPLSQRLPECPSGLDALCLKMLSANKENRPVSVEDIARSMDEILWQLQAPKEEPSIDKPRSALSIIQEISQEAGSAETQAPELPATLATPANPSAEKSPSSTPQPGSGQGSGSNRAHIFQPRSSPSDTLAHGNVGFQPTLPDQSQSPSQRYKVIGELARGGLGKILRATDQHMGRPVAIKEMLQRLPGEFEVRFLREAKITARLEHPAIIPVHDLGKWSDGSMYYTMKLVNGRSFDKIIAENKSIEERIALLPHVIAAADAIAYAHSQHIIHRDLKPHNVLIGPFGETVVIDWGIAKDLSDPTDAESTAAPYREAQDHGELTREGAIVGTPAYMPLEQAQGKKVDARADVYSLGAILYHLLSGKSPYSGKRSVAILRDLLEGPPKPLQERVPDVPKELLTIVEKAMARSADARYPTAQELADDLKKYQTGQLVGSYQYSSWEILVRTLKKYQLPIAVGGLAAVTLLMSAVWYTISLSEKNAVVNRKNREALEANVNLQAANGMLEKNNQEEKDRREALFLELAEAKLDVDPAESLSWLKRLDPKHAKTPWDVVRLIAADAIERGLPEVYGAQWSTPDFVNTSQINHSALSPDGASAASGSVDGSVYLWSLETKTRRELSDIKSRQGKEIRKVTFSWDGARLASAGGDGSVRIWEVSARKSLLLLGHTGAVNDVAFSPDGALVASAGKDGVVRLWSAGGALVAALTGSASNIWSVAFSPDGAVVAAAHTNGEVALWSTKAPFEKMNLLKHRAENETIVELSFSPDGRWLLFSGQETFSAHVWDLESNEGQALGLFPVGVQTAKFSPDSKRIAVADQATNKVMLFSLGSRDRWEERAAELVGHSTRVWCLSFSSDSQRLATASADASVKVWDLSRGKMIKHLRGHRDSVKQVMFIDHSGGLLSVSDDKTLRLWSATPAKAYEGFVDLSLSTTFSPDGQHIAAGGFDNVIRIWDTTQESVQILRGHTMGVLRLAYSPDGAALASSSVDGSLRLWNLSDGSHQVLYQGKDTQGGEVLMAVAYAPNGEHIAAAGYSNKIIVFDTANKKTRELLGHTDAIQSLAFSPDSKTIASISHDYTVRFWDIGSGREVRQLSLPGQGTFVSYSPDGRSVAVTVFDSNVARIIDIQTGEVRDLSAHTDELFQVKFSLDGRLLLSASSDGTVRLWDLKSGKSRPIPQEGNKVYSAAISPDNKRIAVSGTDGKIRVWAGDALQHSSAVLREISAYMSPSVGLSGL